MVQRLRLPEQNKVTLVGRLTADPELRYTQKGQAVCRFSIATGRRYRDSAGVWQEETCYVPIVVWQDIAVRCNERLKKGSPVYVHGRLKTRQWEDKEKHRHSVLEVQAREIQFLQITEKEAAAEEKEPAPAPAAAEEAPADLKKDGESEEIPF